MALAIYLTHLKENCKNIPLKVNKTGLAKEMNMNCYFFTLVWH